MRGPLPSYRPEFPSTFLKQAEKIVRHRTVKYQLRQRATLVLLLEQQPLLSNVEAAERVRRHLRSVQRWRHVLIAQVVKRYERRRVVETERRIVDGTPARVETLRRRSQGDGVINTAYIERLNATFREHLASLTRRGRALARRTLTLQHGMYLIGTVYNFCTPHASLPHASGGTTPAMAAGITDHGWTVQELLSFHVPPPRWTPPKQRGRPSHAFKRLIERWCGDHG
jgi:hypothetical protein